MGSARYSSSDGGGFAGFDADGAGGSGASGEDGSAEAVGTFAHGADGGGDLPAVSRDIDAVMAVPGPGLGDEDEAGASVAEALLEKLTGIAGDEVGGGGGIAVVEDADWMVALAGGEVEERGVEVVEGSCVVGEEFAFEGGVGGFGGGAAVQHGVGDGEGFGDGRAAPMGTMGKSEARSRGNSTTGWSTAGSSPRAVRVPYVDAEQDGGGGGCG